MNSNFIKKVDFKAIGTNWYLEFFQEIDVNVINQLLKIIQDFEEKYSRFIPTSEVSILNEKKCLENPSKDFLEMIQLGAKAKSLTDGAFDISIGGILEETGYDSQKTFIPKENKKYSIGKVNFNNKKITIDENVRIDLGGIGKGFLVEKVKKFLLNQNIKYFLINAGGDIYATSENGKEIEFSLENPFNIEESIGLIKIKNQSIAASSNSKRKWKYKNNDFYHLIDLKTFRPIKNVVGVYTLGTNCINTDIASTSLFLSDQVLYEKISKYYNIEYLIVYEDKTFSKSKNYPAKLFLN